AIVVAVVVAVIVTVVTTVVVVHETVLPKVVISLQSPAMAAVVLKALMQESTIELLHPEATAPPSSLLQPCKVPI
ncbi:unnamed protein product, partial [Cladocopium goreaui]